MVAVLGRQLRLAVLREGRALECSLVTRVRGKAWGDDNELKDWGMVVRNLTVIAAIERQRPNTDGVLVVSVGLGSAVAETLSEAYPVPLERVGIHDKFCPTGRDLDVLMDACGLSVAEIVAAAQRVQARKRK